MGSFFKLYTILFWICFVIPVCASVPSVKLTIEEKEWIKSHPIITLGTDYSWAPYLIKKPDGSVTGYDKDVLDLISKYTGANFQLVTGKWKDMLEMAANKYIDGLSTSAVHKSRKEFFNFSNPYFSTEKLLIVEYSNPKNILSVNDLKGKKIGYQAKNLFEKKLVSRFKNSVKIPLSSYDDLLESLINGRIDVVIGSNAIFYHTGERGLKSVKIIGSVPDSRLDLVFSIRKDYPQLISILNKGLKAIEPEKAELEKKWFYELDRPVVKNREIELTSEEINWLKDHPDIYFGADKHWPPFDYLDEEGNHTGVHSDLVKIINQRLGIDIKVVTGDWVKLQEQVKNKKIDGLLGPSKTGPREKFMLFTDVYAEQPTVLLTRKDYPSRKDLSFYNGKTIYITKGNSDIEYLRKNYPEINVKIKENDLKSISGASSGESYGAVMSLGTASYYMTNHFISNLKIAYIFPSGVGDVRIGIRKDWGVFKNIIQKALNSISKKELKGITRNWLLFDESIENFNYKSLNLTKEEKKWLKNKPYISVTSLENFQPFNFRKNNKPMGYSVEIIELIGEVLGKEIKFIKKPWKEQFEMLKKGEVDVIPHLAVTKGRKDFLSYTDFIHLTFMIGFAVQKDQDINSMKDLKGKTIAVVDSYYLHRHLEKNFPDIKLLPSKSTEEAVEAVANGKAFAIVDNIPTLNYFIREKWLGNLKIDNVIDFGLPLETNMPMGVARSNKHLKSILEKAHAAIPSKKTAALKKTWMYSTPKQKIILTKEEKEYLKKKKKLLMCIDPNWMPFEANFNGKHVGISYEYYKKFEEIIGIPIEFVPSDTWSESLEMGINRECDIFSMIMETPERESFLDFTNPYLKNPLVIATDLNQDRISKISEVIDKKLGIVKGYAFVEILKNKYPDIQLVNVKNVKDGLGKVEKGELFGFLGSHITIGYNIQQSYFGQLKIAGKLDETWHLSVGTRNDEPLLKSIFNKVIETITPQEHQSILNRWVVIDVDDQKTGPLNIGEKRFVKNHPVIRFRVRPDRPPFEVLLNGKVDGISVDYIKAISKKAGFKAEFIIKDMPLKKAFEVMEGDRDLFDTLVFSVKSKEREERFLFGDSYLSYPMMIIGHKKSPYIGKTADLKNKKVAIEEGFLTNKWLKRDYPEIIIIPAKNTKSALQMVNDQMVDAYIGNTAVANYMLTHENMHNLKILAPSDYGNIEYRFVAPKQWPELISILNKGYRSLSPDFHSLIQQKWFSVQIVNNVNYRLLWQVAGVVTLLAVWILWWNRKLFVQKQKTEVALMQLQQAQLLLKEQNKKLETLSITDSLTSLYNRLKLDSVLESELERSKRYKNRFGIIMADIDDFKKVNDTYGHYIGDDVLISFAGLLKNNVRKVDIVGRWGGEEFLIVCPETDKDGILKLAENLRQIIELYDFQSVGNLTASFGVALYDNDQNIESLNSRADNALYFSKENGKNRVSFK